MECFKRKRTWAKVVRKRTRKDVLTKTGVSVHEEFWRLRFFILRIISLCSEFYLMGGLTHRVIDEQPNQFRTHSINAPSQTYKCECQTLTAPSTLLYYSFLSFLRHSLFTEGACRYYISQAHKSYFTLAFHFLTTRIITPRHKSRHYVQPLLPYKMGNFILLFQPH